MKRFHMLLLASAMLLPIGASVASAQMPYISGVPGDDPDYFPGDKYSCSDDENLNPEEQRQVVDAIRARRREVLSESRMREIRLSAVSKAFQNLAFFCPLHPNRIRSG